MMIRAYHRAAISVAMLLALVLPSLAIAQSYPAKPIRLVVGFAPGGGVDLTARLISEKLSSSIKQPIIVENRAGAGGTIAEDFVSKAEPDGYTILYAVGSDITSRKFLTTKPTIDPLKDLTPIATAIGSVNCIVVGPSLPAKSFKELVEYTKRNPGKLTYGTAGVQSYYYLIGELLNQHGVKMLHVPFKGVAPVMTGLIGSQIDVALVNFAAASPHIEARTAKALAVLEPKRYPGAPEVPAVSEELPEFNAPLSWFGFFGPPGLPQSIVEKLNSEVAAALEAPDVRSRISAVHLNIISTPPDQLRPFIMDTSDSFSKIIKAAGIQPHD